MHFTYILGVCLSVAWGNEDSFRHLLNSKTKTVGHTDVRKFRTFLNENFEVLAGKTSDLTPKVRANVRSLELYRKTDVILDLEGTNHTVTIALKQNKLSELKTFVDEISNPFHLNYGQYLSHADVQSMTENHEARMKVLHYLGSEGIRIEGKVRSSYISFQTSLSRLQRMFSAEFHHYRHQTLDFHVIRSESYAVPSELGPYVSAVFRLADFPNSRYIHYPHVHAPSILSAIDLTDSDEVNDYVIPSLLNRLYNISDNNCKGLGSQAVYESIGQSYSPLDLRIFQIIMGIAPETMDYDVGGHRSNGACDSKDGQDCIEANLDVQYIMSVAQNTTNTYYYWDGDDFMLDWIKSVSEMEDPPLVFSISYGADEREVTAEYVASFDAEALKLAAQGVTILASSGDDGVAGASARDSPLFCGYFPDFPATSVYVTAVGGTMGPEKGDPETACMSSGVAEITTGGGFSELLPRPAWQNAAVEGYFRQLESTGVRLTKGYNEQGRGYPDVSALARNYIVAINRNFTSVSGTSASTPVVAGMVSLVNAARLAAGKSAVGWLNPSLYALKDHFINDITEGENNCVASSKICCGQGFTSTVGWDPLTGLGSIDFGKFKETLLALGSNTLSQPSSGPTVVAGAPTLQPVGAPTPFPLNDPTVSPTQGNGWVFINTYEEMNCGGLVNEISALPTNKCIIEYDAISLEVVGAQRYICEANRLYLAVYTDESCKESSLTDSTEYFLGCAVSVIDYYYSSHPYSTSLECIPSADASFILPSNGKDYVLNIGYNSQRTCDEDTISSIAGYINNYCYNEYSDTKEDSSYIFEFPKAFFFQGSDCRRPHPDKEVLNTECAVNSDNLRRKRAVTSDESSENENYEGLNFLIAYADNNNDDSTSDVFFTQWSLKPGVVSNPTHSPTFATSVPSVATNSYKPSVMLTAAPSSRYITATPSVVPSIVNTISDDAYFFANQMFLGVSSASYNANVDKFNLVFKTSVVDIMPKEFTIGDVAVLYISESYPTREILETMASVESCNVTYKISYSLSRMHFPNEYIGFQELKSSLQQNIQSGNFDQVLQRNAVLQHVLELANVTTAALLVDLTYSLYNPPDIPITENDDVSNEYSSSDSSTRDVIFGIILVILIGGVVLLMVCYRNQIASKIFNGKDYNAILRSSDHNGERLRSDSVAADVESKDTYETDREAVIRDLFPPLTASQLSDIEMTITESKNKQSDAIGYASINPLVTEQYDDDDDEIVF